VSLQPVLDHDGVPLDQIRLAGLAARGHHGVFEHERRDGQDFVVDVVLHLDTRTAAGSDEVTDTVHYGELAVGLADVLRGEPVHLLERLVDRLARVCLADRRVAATDITVHKPGAPIPERFADVAVAVRRTRLDIPAAEPARVVLALGANLGDRAAALQAALDDLARVDGVRVEAVSPVVETQPVGGPVQPCYLNAVALLRTTLSPLALLSQCQRVEQAHGRLRGVRWGARTLDLDLVAYGDLADRGDRLELPHPRAAGRAFVLAPWAALDPGAELAGRPVAELLAAADDRDGVRPLADLTLRVPA
jgi:dihydroneopterin aldolase / 2-amino-4-hydroxy-6-hydroxymethyldihydropteridine diphosphokinase